MMNMAPYLLDAECCIHLLFSYILTLIDDTLLILEHSGRRGQGQPPTHDDNNQSEPRNRKRQREAMKSRHNQTMYSVVALDTENAAESGMRIKPPPPVNEYYASENSSQKRF
jgi:hypothetical protein